MYTTWHILACQSLHNTIAGFFTLFRLAIFEYLNTLTIVPLCGFVHEYYAKDLNNLLEMFQSLISLVVLLRKKYPVFLVRY